MITGTSKNLGVIGYPIIHSLSPTMQNSAIDAAGLDAVYIAMEVSPEELTAAVKGLRATGFIGWNVTIPHKTAIIPLLDEVDTLVSAIPGCNVLLMNHNLRLKLRSAARRAGFYNREVNGFGANVEYYGNIPMIDAGKHVNELGQEVDIIPTEGGKTALYGAAVALDGLHGISPDGQSIVNVYLPDLQAPGAVKRGEVEIVAGIALKQSRKAGVLKDIKIAAAG